MNEWTRVHFAFPVVHKAFATSKKKPWVWWRWGVGWKASLGSESWRSDTLPVEIKGEHIHAPLILCPYNRHTFLGLSKEILFQDSASSSSPGTRSVRIPSSALSFLADFSQFFFSRCSCEYLSLTFLCSVKRHLLLHLDLVGNTRAVVYPRGNS